MQWNKIDLSKNLINVEFSNRSLITIFPNNYVPLHVIKIYQISCIKPFVNVNIVQILSSLKALQYKNKKNICNFISKFFVLLALVLFISTHLKKVIDNTEKYFIFF